MYRFLLLLALLSLAACTREADQPRPADPPPDTLAADPPALADTSRVAVADTVPALDPDPAKAEALDTALDTLEAFVEVLERVEGPIKAWNQAAAAARLLRYLEQNQAAFVLDDSAEAARRYPARIARLSRLEVRRAAELKRIGEDPVAAQVLIEEMAKANAEAEGR